MEDRGFPYVPTVLDDLQGPLDNLGVLTLYNREQAHQWGYGGISSFRNEDDPDGVSSITGSNDEYILQLSDAEYSKWDRALMGTSSVSDLTEAQQRLLEESVDEGKPLDDALAQALINTDGCIGGTEAAIYGDLYQLGQLDYAVRSLMREEVRSRIEASPAFVSAVAEWAACMQRQGYGFAEPHEAVGAVSQAYAFETAAAAQALEAEIAPADGRCSEDSGLFDAVDAEMLRAAEEVVAEREGEILAYRELIAAAVANAKRLLNAG